MKNYIQYIPITAFAAAIALGGSVKAEETAPEATSKRDQQVEGQLPTHAAEKNAKVGKTKQVDSQRMTASEVLGMNIDTATNEKIGEIDEIYIASDTGEVLAVVVSTGGFLGMGENQSLISPEDLRFNTDRTLLQADLSKDQVRTAPNYIKGETAGLDKVRPLGRTASNRKERTESTTRIEGELPDGRGLALADLSGMTVENRQGETIGEVDEVFLDLENRKVAGVVVSTGGFLGMGERKTLFGIREMSFDPSNEKIVLDYNRDQIGKFQEYKDNDQSVFDGLRDRSDRSATSASTKKTSDGARTEARNVGTSTKSSSDMTVFDQGNSSEEIDMTASIRTAIRDDDTLSSKANNVTIITNNGKVLLRGEVDSTLEKTTIEGIAQNKAGRENATSELTVHAP